MIYVYILLCSDGSYYTGVTNNLYLRLFQHEMGEVPRCYTYSRRPLKLVYYEEYQNPIDAIRREKQIKGWSRAKKEALIRGEYEELPKLSKSSHAS